MSLKSLALNMTLLPAEHRDGVEEVIRRVGHDSDHLAIMELVELHLDEQLERIFATEGVESNRAEGQYQAFMRMLNSLDPRRKQQTEEGG